ncbi:GTP-binding protein [Cupriavidus basilensis]
MDSSDLWQCYAESLGALSSLGMRVRVVTTFACDQRIARDDFPLMAQQVCAAHSVVLTRLDMVTTQQIIDAAAEVKAMGPMAHIIVGPDPQARAREALRLSEDGKADEVGPSPSEGAFLQHPRIQVFTLRWTAELPWTMLQVGLRIWSSYFDSRLLRTKGLMRFAGFGQVLLIQGVGQHLDTPRRMPAIRADDSSLVVICRDACAAEVASLDPAIPGLEVTSRNAGNASIRLARPAY